MAYKPTNFSNMKENFGPGGGLIDSFPDSPLSCTEDRLPYWDKGEDAVLWSNAAFRSYDMGDGDGEGSSSSARTSLGSIRFNEDWRGFSTRNGMSDDEHANAGGLAKNASRFPNFESVEKPKLCRCHALGGPVVIAVNVSVGGVMAAQGSHTIYHVDGNPRQNQINLHCECQAPVGKIHSTPAGKPNSLAPGRESLLEGFQSPQSVEEEKDGMNSGICLDGGEISEEEAKIKAELENEIEKDLENEIKDGICDLTRKLAELYAYQKTRSGDAQKPKSAIAGNAGDGNNVGMSHIVCSGSESVPSTPPIGGSGGKISGGGKSWEKKNRRGISEKDFDWVRTLRASTVTSPNPEVNKGGKPNFTVAAPERLCSDHPIAVARGCSRALFMDYGIPSNRDEEASVSKPRRCRRHGCSHSPKDGNAVHVALRGCAKHCDRISPMDGDACRGKCGTESGVLKRMGNRKGATDPIGQAENVKNTSVGRNSEEERLLLTDMMNRLQISDSTKGSGEKPKKIYFSENKLLHEKGG